MSQADTVVVTIKTFVLKVNVDCKGCEKRVRKTLGKIDGVYTTTIDGENRTLTVSGNVDPPIIIKKLKKIGKHAELLPSEGEKNQPNNEAQGMQTVDGQDGNPQTDGKGKKGKRQPQVPQVGGMQELRLPLLNHMRLPSHVPVNLGHGEGDVGDDEINEMDIIDDDGPDEVVVLPNMNAVNGPGMNQGQQQSSVAAAPIKGSANGNQGGGNGGMSANMGDGRNNNPTNGNGGKKGGGKKGGTKNQAGAGGVAQNGGPQQATGDARSNNGAAIDIGVVNNGAAGMVKGGGAQNVVAHGFNGMNIPGGALNVGNMKGNIPLPPMLNTHFPSMGNIPAAPGPMPTRPELNIGMQSQGLKPQVLTANPYHQQYPATLMMPPPPYGMYPLKPAAYMPQAWLTGEPNVNYFSEENPNGCSIM
ncbi:hypothetical protein MRB53_029212 [Persea americana]|uniref:Uncharacterized protein n=1 Tax=Persea americana TaxID=3435 RepID=A0ACC2KIF9_PERAE|nr:hypothetical protein MRB53_029212 [Persea americana]